jgi:recombinational DNA repair protein (RecF pathway)
MRGANHCARCGAKGVELQLSWVTMEPICLRCYLGLVPLRPGDLGAGLTHPTGGGTSLPGR